MTTEDSVQHHWSQRALPLLMTVLCGWAMILPGCTELPEEEPVVAMINGRAITQNEFEVRWNELSQATRARYEKEGGKRRFSMS